MYAKFDNTGITSPNNVTCVQLNTSSDANITGNVISNSVTATNGVCGGITGYTPNSYQIGYSSKTTAGSGTTSFAQSAFGSYTTFVAYTITIGCWRVTTNMIVL